MRWIVSVISSFMIIHLAGCDKAKRDCSDYIKPVGISQTITPDTVDAGQPIISKISGYYPNLEGQQLDAITVSQTGDKHYGIRVNAKFPGCQNIVFPAFWYYDTSVMIPTASPGEYILIFDGVDSVFYDTVQVTN